MTIWRDWSGLPWELGADPRSGRAACCFKTAQAVRETLGMPWPWSARKMKSWYRRAGLGLWDDLREEWDALTEPLQKGEAGALIRFDNPLDGSFGVGVLGDQRTFITVRHRGRLIIGPLSSCRKPHLYALK